MKVDRLSGFRALGTMLLEPYLAFVHVTESPSLLVPYGMAMLVAMFGFAIVLPATLATIEPGQAATPGIKGVAVVTGVLVALVTPWLAAFVSALALAAASMVAGGTMEFRTHMSIAGYARIPLVIQGAILATMSLQLPNLQEARNLTLSLAAVLPSGGPVIRSILSSIGPFEIWHFFLLTCGLAAALRTKPARVWWFGCVMFGLKVLLSVATASVQGLLGA